MQTRCVAVMLRACLVFTDCKFNFLRDWILTLDSFAQKENLNYEPIIACVIVLCVVEFSVSLCSCF